MKSTTILVVFAVTCLYTGTSGYAHQTLSEFMFRRQIDRAACNSYVLFRGMLQSVTNPQVDSFMDNLFRQSPITGDILRTESTAICSDIAGEATALSQDSRTSTSCFNTEAAADLMGVYSGLCTREGHVTAFFTALTADFESVEMSSWTSACMTKMLGILLTCPFLSVGRNTGLEEGPEIYKSQVQESFQCIFAGIDTNDTSMCGDTTSLKKLFLIIELLFNLSPGVNFTMQDFGF